MNQILVDTQVLLWLFNGDRKLSSSALQLLSAPTSERFFSHAGVWEIAIKYGKGKLQLPDSPDIFVTKHLKLNKIRPLPISMASIFAAGALPQGKHSDPFDRLMAAQCLRYNLTLVSCDPQFDSYGVRRIW